MIDSLRLLYLFEALYTSAWGFCLSFFKMWTRLRSFFLFNEHSAIIRRTVLDRLQDFPVFLKKIKQILFIFATYTFLQAAFKN